MSIIVAKRINNKTIEIGCDTQITTGWYMKEDWGDRGFSKIEKFDNVTIGAVGDARSIRYLTMFCETNKIKNATEREIVRFFYSYEKWIKENTTTLFQIEGCSFILVMENKILTFNNFLVSEIKDFYAIGSGKKWALPALELGASTEKAIEIACKYDLFCSGEAKIFKIQKR